ncbi:TolC family protein [Campylobacter sp. RM16192]|uniref:TolC family protein n=1 Tax=Campylobacter sp. RM16192 TaxID=1660080 RepID=UPI0014527E22|nr:TolC family protein [Campylobacter sp. RM16192]QCD52642.1 TolC-like outer membrane efflux protein [Campylobacter sp. RM16192]
MKRILIFVFVILFSGCAVKSINEDYNKLILDENLSLNFEFEQEWWKGYERAELNELVRLALKNNTNLLKVAISINKALAQAGVVSANLIPNFNANFTADVSKNLEGDKPSKSYKSGVSLNYEIDLWQKLANSRDAALWEANATKFDAEAARLALINSVVDSYFEIIYLNESLELYDAALKNYRELEAITRAKFELGKGEELSLKQIQSSLLNAQNKVLNAQKNLNLAKQTLRILLAESPEFEFKFAKISLENIKFLGVNLDAALYAISNRPDLKAAIARIEESLLNVKVSQKSFYPSVSIAAILSGSGDRTSEAFSLKFLGGNLNLNLPFLNYSRLKNSLKISEANFELAKINYFETLIKSLNELDTAYKNLKNDELLLKNYEKQAINFKEISEIYRLKFDAGKGELKDYLQARNSELDARSNLILQRYKLLQDEINIYKAMAGRVK